MIRLLLTLGLIGLLTIFIYRYHLPNSPLVIGGAFSGSTVSGEGFPKIITDPIGQSYPLNAPAKRVVSAMLAGDEMLQQLGALDEVVSVTYLADDTGISNVSNYYPEIVYRNHSEIEEILSLTPDLVVAAPYTNAVTVRLLLANNIPVIRFPRNNSFHDIDDNMRLLAEVLDKNEQVVVVLEEMWKRIRYTECLTKNYKKPRVLYYSLSGSTAGEGTLTDEMIRYAGGFNVTNETQIKGYSSITAEYAVSLQPEVLVLTDWYAQNSQEALGKLRENPLWIDVPAVVNERIYIMAARTSSTVTPFRVRGIEELAVVLHPELHDPDNTTRCAIAENL